MASELSADQIIEAVGWRDKMTAKDIAAAYWADKADPADAEQKLFTLFRLAATGADTDLIREAVFDFLEANKPE